MSDYGEEVWIGGVPTWECDANGHLNVRHYIAKSMEALASFVTELGLPGAFAREARTTVVVREQHVRFLKEARPATSLSITGGVLRLGETDARLFLVMHHLNGDVAAAFQLGVEHVDAASLAPQPWPDAVRRRAAELKVAVPERLAPRSISLEPVNSLASLGRAKALGLVRANFGVILEPMADAFGRMRTEGFMTRISDGVSRVTGGHTRVGGEPPVGRRMGGAALEYRLVHFAWPRVGDRVELRSGNSGAEPKFRRMVHWLLDAETGQAYGSAEAVVAALDLETRKLAPFSDEALAALRAQSVEGLAL